MMQLHEYQKRLANFIARQPRAVISVDMGLGKTAAVLAWLDWYERKRAYTAQAIIIAPKRVAENNWLQEAIKWGLVDLSNRMTICAGTPRKRAQAWQDVARPVKIVSRDNFNDYAHKVTDVLIIDELTSFKSPTASRSKAVCSIRAQVKVGLTGTFLANGAIDIYGQTQAVGIDWGMNFYAWRATHFRDVLAGSGLQFQKWRLHGALIDLLKPIKQNIFTLTAADYLTIPPVTNTVRAVDVGERTREQIAEMDAFLSTELNGEVLTFTEQQKFAKLQTLCNGFVYVTDEQGETRAVRGERSEKLEQVADFVADCKDAGEPVLLFYAYREEAAWLTELLNARNVRVGNPDSKDFVQHWNEHDYDCLMCHPASAGHGLNLQHGGRVIVWSTLTYNYELFAQGNARLARQGQPGNVQIYYYVADKTCEQRALAALMKKQQEQNQFLKITKQ